MNELSATVLDKSKTDEVFPLSDQGQLLPEPIELSETIQHSSENLTSAENLLDLLEEYQEVTEGLSLLLQALENGTINDLLKEMKLVKSKSESDPLRHEIAHLLAIRNANKDSKGPITSLKETVESQIKDHEEAVNKGYVPLVDPIRLLILDVAAMSVHGADRLQGELTSLKERYDTPENRQKIIDLICTIIETIQPVGKAAISPVKKGAHTLSTKVESLSPRKRKLLVLTLLGSLSLAGAVAGNPSEQHHSQTSIQQGDTANKAPEYKTHTTEGE